MHENEDTGLGGTRGSRVLEALTRDTCHTTFHSLLTLRVHFYHLFDTFTPVTHVLDFSHMMVPYTYNKQAQGAVWSRTSHYNLWWATPTMGRESMVNLS